MAGRAEAPQFARSVLTVGPRRPRGHGCTGAPAIRSVGGGGPSPLGPTGGMRPAVRRNLLAPGRIRLYRFGVRRVLVVTAVVVLLVPAAAGAALHSGASGTRVRALQLELAWHGF